MAKTKKLLPLKIGCLVAFNELPDATWFKVIAISGFHLTVREYHEKHIYQNQYTDTSLVKQVKYLE